jgi:hypothetical protein
MVEYIFDVDEQVGPPFSRLLLVVKYLVYVVADSTARFRYHICIEVLLTVLFQPFMRVQKFMGVS